MGDFSSSASGATDQACFLSKEKYHLVLDGDSGGVTDGSLSNCSAELASDGVTSSMISGSEVCREDCSTFSNVDTVVEVLTVSEISMEDLTVSTTVTVLFVVVTLTTPSALSTADSASVDNSCFSVFSATSAEILELSSVPLSFSGTALPELGNIGVSTSDEDASTEDVDSTITLSLPTNTLSTITETVCLVVLDSSLAGFSS